MSECSENTGGARAAEALCGTQSWRKTGQKISQQGGRCMNELSMNTGRGRAAEAPCGAQNGRKSQNGGRCANERSINTTGGLLKSSAGR